MKTRLMAARASYDHYFVDSSKDIVFEFVNEGIDSVISTATMLRLPNNVESLQLFHSGTKFAFNGLGNDLDNGSASGFDTGGLFAILSTKPTLTAANFLLQFVG